MRAAAWRRFARSLSGEASWEARWQPSSGLTVPTTLGGAAGESRGGGGERGQGAGGVGGVPADAPGRRGALRAASSFDGGQCKATLAQHRNDGRPPAATPASATRSSVRSGSSPGASLTQPDQRDLQHPAAPLTDARPDAHTDPSSADSRWCRTPGDRTLGTWHRLLARRSSRVGGSSGVRCPAGWCPRPERRCGWAGRRDRGRLPSVRRRGVQWWHGDQCER